MASSGVMAVEPSQRPTTQRKEDLQSEKPPKIPESEKARESTQPPEGPQSTLTPNKPPHGEKQQRKSSSRSSRFSITLSWTSSSLDGKEEGIWDESWQGSSFSEMGANLRSGRWSAVSDLTGTTYNGNFCSKRSSEISFFLDGQEVFDMDADEELFSENVGVRMIDQIGVALSELENEFGLDDDSTLQGEKIDVEYAPLVNR